MHCSGNLWQMCPLFLYTFWSLATAAAVLALVPIPRLSAFRKAVHLSACRGKLWEGKPECALGPISDWKVPQAWFAHFYAVGLLVNTAAIFFLKVHQVQAAVLLSLGFLQVHLMRRFLESHFLLTYPKYASMHLVAYLFGLVYYTFLPLTCLPSATFKASEPRGAKTLHTQLHMAGSREFCKLLGAAIFILGNVLQHDSHRLLARLSLQKKASQQRTQYSLPQGGAFEWVSCPHYLGEIVIYIGLTLTLELDRPLSWLPLAWVVANLVLAAGMTHKWYHQTFKEYPKHRRALIPAVY